MVVAAVTPAKRERLRRGPRPRRRGLATYLGADADAPIVGAMLQATAPPLAFASPLAAAQQAAGAPQATEDDRADFLATPVGPHADFLATPVGPQSARPAQAPAAAPVRLKGHCLLSVPAPAPVSGQPEASARAVPEQIPFLHKYYSIDVECVASGTQHNDRVVAQISLVRGDGAVLLDLYVKPVAPVVSYITPLTGLTREMLEERGMPLEAALVELRLRLPRHAVLVGQGIENDVRWLGLVQGTDFEGMLDLAALWRVWNHSFRSWSVFSQEHLSRVLLGEDIAGGAHNAVDDAIKAVKLFRLHTELMQMGGVAMVEEAKARLLMFTVSPPFKKRYPVFEGVCMGDRRSCRCGAPFLFT